MSRVADNLKHLRRRRDFLAARVATYRKDGNPSYDKAELGALNWAIAVVEEARRQDLLAQLTRTRSFV